MVSVVMDNLIQLLVVGCSVETIALSLSHQTSPTAATLPINRILI
uniref:Uncharacterized protein n=1 Tax=Fagus sylvatica TaxID=28930 RepID=A0A2N9FWS8_FAGSY